MSIVTQITNLATRAAAEDKALRNLINNNKPDLDTLTTTTKTNLVAAINELKASTNNIELGGFAVELANPQEKDLLQLSSSKWRNTSQDNITDGGNF
jgi:hypothetical protein